MKKYIGVLGIIIIMLILCVTIFFLKNPIDIEGKILLNMTHNGKNGITIYDCSKREFQELSLGGLAARFLDGSTIFIDRYDIITKYDLNTKKETMVYNDEPFDFFVPINDICLSISIDNCIFLYNLETKEKSLLVQNNGSKIHSWSKSGDVLYYSDINNKIISFDVLSGEINEIGIGYDPVICCYNIAYKNKDKLIVKNMQTDKEYIYNGMAYSYCFSPDGSKLVIEDEISISTAIKNFFKKDIVLGHRIVVWNYESNHKDTIIDSCISTPNMVCDWK